MNLHELTFVIKGGGEMASGIAWRLFRSGFSRIIMIETATPVAIRRLVSFSEAVYDEEKIVDGVRAVLVKNSKEADKAISDNYIPVIVDPEWQTVSEWHPDVVIDAIIAKKNLGTHIGEGELVIGLGPGFHAGSDVHLVIETNRGADCGRVIHTGSAEENTGTPGSVMGHSRQRVVRAPESGIFKAMASLDEIVRAGALLGEVAGVAVAAQIDGKVRGLIRDQITVTKGDKIGDIEPRMEVNCHLISDKSLALAGGILEAVLWRYNRAS